MTSQFSESWDTILKLIAKSTQKCYLVLRLLGWLFAKLTGILITCQHQFLDAKLSCWQGSYESLSLNYFPKEKSVVVDARYYQMVSEFKQYKQET